MSEHNEIAPFVTCTLQPTEHIENLIVEVRGIQTMLDRDLAMLYGVSTKRLNEQVRRNIERFPVHFRFQLTDNETSELVANCDRLQNLKHSSVNPYVFTEQGVAMLSADVQMSTHYAAHIKAHRSFMCAKVR